MSESRGHTNGAERSEQGTQFPQHLSEAGRQIRGDAQNLVTHVSEAGNELQFYLREVARDRPLGVLAVAAGVGYLLGGGLSSRLTVLALGVGTRFAMAVAAREMGGWALQSGNQQRQLGGSQGQREGQQGQQGQGQGQRREGQNREGRGGGQSGSGGSSQTH
jgi:hypothetical protein